MLMVMVAMSTSLVLAYTLIQTQTVALHLTQNAVRRDLAADAAQTGMSVALRTMQTTNWEGVSVPLLGIVSSDASGTASYHVTFEQATDEPTVEAVHSSLLIRVRSKGTWEAAAGSQRTQHEVIVVAKLLPRLPGRSVAAVDEASVTDVKANATGYDTIQDYALTAKSSSTPLVLDPADRIEGNIYLRGNIALFQDPSWSNSIRANYLSSVGDRFVSQVEGNRQFQHPHPLAGEITFQSYPNSSLSSDLLRLKTPWRYQSASPSFPSVNFSGWQQYRLYERGFQYSATSLSSTLQSSHLQPSTTNPLGIYYRNGSLSIRSDVHVEGTIVCTGKVTISGDHITLGGRTWRDSNGDATVEDLELWPRLPTIVADEIEFDRPVSANIDGAIVVRGNLYGAGGTFDYESVWDLSLSGLATARPLDQPFSEIQVQGIASLYGFSGGENYAIWIERGTSGDWFPIVSVDATRRTLRVAGEVSCPTATPFFIQKCRKAYVSIRGPVYADKMDVNRPDEWVLSSSGWNTLSYRWQNANDYRAWLNLPPVNFSEYLEDPSNFWSLYYSPYTQWTYGLRLESTFHLRNTSDVNYQFEPPLFAPSNNPSLPQFAGYRWQILSWREN